MRSSRACWLTVSSVALSYKRCICSGSQHAHSTSHMCPSTCMHLWVPMHFQVLRMRMFYLCSTGAFFLPAYLLPICGPHMRNIFPGPSSCILMCTLQTVSGVHTVPARPDRRRSIWMLSNCRYFTNPHTSYPCTIWLCVFHACVFSPGASPH